MKIAINKDLEVEYKDEFFKGFSLLECMCILLSLIIVAGVAVFSVLILGVSPYICVYTGLPFAAPVLFLGFKHYQGLTCLEYLKEIRWEQKTKRLIYDAEELPETDYVFTMKRNMKCGRKRRRG